MRLSDLNVAVTLCLSLHRDEMNDLLRLLGRKFLQTCRFKCPQTELQLRFNDFLAQQVRGGAFVGNELLAERKLTQTSDIVQGTDTLKAVLVKVVFAAELYGITMQDVIEFVVPSFRDITAAVAKIVAIRNGTKQPRAARGVIVRHLEAALEYTWNHAELRARFTTNRRYFLAFLCLYKHIGGKRFEQLNGTPIFARIAATLKVSVDSFVAFEPESVIEPQREVGRAPGGASANIQANPLVRADAEQDVSETERRDISAVNVDDITITAATPIQTPPKRTSSGEQSTEPKRPALELQRQICSPTSELDDDIDFDEIEDSVMPRLCTCIRSPNCDCHPNSRPFACKTPPLC